MAKRKRQTAAEAAADAILEGCAPTAAARTLANALAVVDLAPVLEQIGDSAYSRLKLRELQRFLVLKAVTRDGEGGSPLALSPSSQVDHAWHALMLRPGLYWAASKALGFETPIEHDPLGGRDAAARAERLQRTRDLYKGNLGVAPPPEAWDEAAPVELDADNDGRHGAGNCLDDSCSRCLCEGCRVRDSLSVYEQCGVSSTRQQVCGGSLLTPSSLRFLPSRRRGHSSSGAAKRERSRLGWPCSCRLAVGPPAPRRGGSCARSSASGRSSAPACCTASTAACCRRGGREKADDCVRQGWKRGKVSCKVKTTTRARKVLDEYCERKGICPSDVRFISPYGVDMRAYGDIATLLECHLKDGSVIDCFQQQCGC